MLDITSITITKCTLYHICHASPTCFGVSRTILRTYVFTYNICFCAVIICGTVVVSLKILLVYSNDTEWNAPK